MSKLNVTDEAVISCRELAQRIEKEYSALLSGNRALKLQFEENRDGLGRHANSISDLIDKLNQQLRMSRDVKKITLKLQRVSSILTDHIEGSFPLATSGEGISSAPANQTYLTGVMSRIYARGYQKMHEPIVGGIWNGNIFTPDMNTVPTKYNPTGRNFGQIIEHLEKNYGIHFIGIPFHNGLADFSSVAVAQVDYADIIQAYYPNLVEDADSVDYRHVFADRTKNFKLADLFAAAQQLPIHGLQKGYTADDLEEWRNANHFTWEESPIYGYLLVPAEIHNNIPHTGLVALESHGADAEKRIFPR